LGENPNFAEGELLQGIQAKILGSSDESDLSVNY
jgi:hypothetical protein